MTQNNNTDDDSSKTMMTRRNVLIGLGVAGAGTLAGLDNFTDVLEDGGGSNLGPDNPPLTNPNDGNNTDTDEPAFQTPWNTDSLVITVEWNEQDSIAEGFFERLGYENLELAVAWWNDYIDANAAFDLTLTFERNHDNPDILLKQANHMGGCGPEYKGPGFGNNQWMSGVCVDTLRETPGEDDLPVTGTFTNNGGGAGVYRLIAKHAIGRLLGYDIWSDPVHVMNPKITIIPSDAASFDNDDYYFQPNAAYTAMQDKFGPQLPDDLLTELQNPSHDTKPTLEALRNKLTNYESRYNEEFDNWQDTIDEIGLDVFTEAYQETIATDELPYIEETTTLTSDLHDTYSIKELADGPDELNTLADRVKTLTTWPDTVEPFDVQIHRHVTDALWSAWTAEQTPTTTENNSA